MEYFLTPLLSYVLLYKYFALAAVVYVGAVGVPLPVNAMLLALGALASQGYFSFWVSVVVAVIFNTLGDLTGYGIAWRYGEKITKFLRLRKAQFFIYLEEELRSDAAITVFMTRFTGSLSSIANILAGLVHVPFKKFLIYDFFGNIIEPFAALAIGYLVGDYWSNFSSFFGILTGVVAVGVIMFVLIRMQRRIAKKYSEHQ